MKDNDPHHLRYQVQHEYLQYLWNNDKEGRQDDAISDQFGQAIHQLLAVHA